MSANDAFNTIAKEIDGATAVEDVRDLYKKIKDLKTHAKTKIDALHQGSEMLVVRSKFEGHVRDVAVGEAVACCFEEWIVDVTKCPDRKYVTFTVTVQMNDIEASCGRDDRIQSLVGSCGEMRVAKMPPGAVDYKKAVHKACSKFYDACPEDLLRRSSFDEDVAYDSDRDHHRCWVSLKCVFHVAVRTV
jgi:hypothetical protein